MGASLVVIGGVVSVISVAIAVAGTPARDVVVDPAGSEVAWVLPGGGSWEDGIRAGQTLVQISYGATLDDWNLVTSDQRGDYSSPSRSHVERLRDTLPQAVGALGMGLLGILLIGRRRRVAGAVALLSLGLASASIAASDQPTASAAILVAVPLAAALWLSAQAQARLRMIWLPVPAGGAAFWLGARIWWPATYEAADTLRSATAVTLLAVAAAAAAPWREWLVGAVRLDPSLTVDLGASVIILSGAALAVILLAVPAVVAAPVAVVLLALYPRVRHRLGTALEHLILGDMRDHAAITATEEERARLASEIHDGPLQELAAVIGELDDTPHMDGAANLLREVAAELRGVTTALRPPVLDDLGLGAAVAWLVDQARLRGESGPHITCSVADHSEVGRAGRPPAEVELAAFRIIQEALTNALTHAGATEIAVAGSIERLSIELQVTDDGRGLDEASVRNARRIGRLGLRSMRQRASAIAAELVVGNRSGGGTSVAVRWSAT